MMTPPSQKILKVRWSMVMTIWNLGWTLRKVAIAWSTNSAVSVVTMYHLQGLRVQVSGHIGKISCPQMHQTSSPRLITAEARGSVCSSIWCIWTKSVHLSIGHYPMTTNMYHVPKMPEIGAKAPKKTSPFSEPSVVVLLRLDSRRPSVFHQRSIRSNP